MTTITVRSANGFQQEIIAGKHTLFADEPVSVGGGDIGPSPYELLLSALGACKSMTITMYARRKGWKLEGVEIHLTHDREYARDCEDCPEKRTQIDRITVKLILTGQLDEAQRQRLKQIAARCPVHQTLIGQIQIDDID